MVPSIKSGLVVTSEICYSGLYGSMSKITHYQNVVFPSSLRAETFRAAFRLRGELPPGGADGVHHRAGAYAARGGALGVRRPSHQPLEAGPRHAEIHTQGMTAPDATRTDLPDNTSKSEKSGTYAYRVTNFCNP